jgi:hypothetical protein
MAVPKEKEARGESSCSIPVQEDRILRDSGNLVCVVWVEHLVQVHPLGCVQPDRRMVRILASASEQSVGVLESMEKEQESRNASKSELTGRRREWQPAKPDDLARKLTDNNQKSAREIPEHFFIA